MAYNEADAEVYMPSCESHCLTPSVAPKTVLWWSSR